MQPSQTVVAVEATCKAISLLDAIIEQEEEKVNRNRKTGKTADDTQQDQSSGIVRSTAKSLACDACRRARAKCIRDAAFATTGVCARCHGSQSDCVFSPSQVAGRKRTGTA